MSKKANQPFYIGRGIHTKIDYHINPDAPQQNNPHIMITGASGSGKTRELKELIRHFVDGNKFVFVIDFHGDVSVQGETVFKFTARNSPYGINLFEFDKDLETGGVTKHCQKMVNLFRRFSFGAKIGSVQTSTLQRLFLDTYTSKGILDEDETSWHKKAPTIEDLQALMQRILDLADSPSSTLTSPAIEQYQTFVEHAMNVALRHETTQEELDDLQKEFREKLDTVHQRTDLIDCDKNCFGELVIDTQFYLKKDILKRVESLKDYIDTIVASKAFSANDPNLKGLTFVRFDLSGLDVESIAVMSDILIGRIFRSKKSRGEYRYYEDKSRGAKVDTYIVVDEGRMILPNGPDKENPYNHLNMIAAQSRKFGLGMILVSQRISHFPGELLANIEQKILFKVGDGDKKTTGNIIGIFSTQEQKIFDGLESKGICLVKSNSRWNLVALPWSEKFVAVPSERSLQLPDTTKTKLSLY